jgi:hypothetical protein
MLLGTRRLAKYWASSTLLDLEEISRMVLLSFTSGTGAASDFHSGRVIPARRAGNAASLQRRAPSVLLDGRDGERELRVVVEAGNISGPI